MVDRAQRNTQIVRITKVPATDKRNVFRNSQPSLQRRIKITEKTSLMVRFDVVNILDTIYELRDMVLEGANLAQARTGYS